MGEDSEVKKSKGTKKCVLQRELMFENYRDCLLNDKIILKSQERFESDNYKVYTQKSNKIALSSNDDKRYIPDHSYRILMIGGSGYEKTTLLLNLIENQPDIDKYIYTQKFHMNQNINNN